MTEAPERIWAYNELRSGYTFTAKGPQPYFGPVEYVRADLFEAMKERVEKAEGLRAWTDVQAERRRQVEAEGWHTARDDMYTSNELALAGASYALAAAYYHADPYAAASTIWPWGKEWLKPTTPRRDLVKAAALILAEIERLDRATLARLTGDA